MTLVQIFLFIKKLNFFIIIDVNLTDKYILYNIKLNSPFINE